MFVLRLLLATLFALAVSVSSAAVAPRQIGSLACNVARLKTVAALGSTGDAIGSIANTTTQAAAQAGLDQANGGIKAIAGALLSGDAAPASGRTDVAAGLAAMNTTLAAGDA